MHFFLTLIWKDRWQTLQQEIDSFLQQNGLQRACPRFS
jgi:hypothetical protein